MKQEQIRAILKRYSEGTATAEEKALIESWYEQFGSGEQIINEAHLQAIEDEVFTRLPISQNVPVRRLWARIAAAASIILAISVGAYFILHKAATQQITVLKPGTFKNDIQPGGNNAILTLASGKQIVLKTAKTGLLASQGNTQVQKTGDGQIIYNAANNSTSETTVTYNTVTTKRGDKYNVTLPDGTVAYLDAASSIHFPTAFSGNDRPVSITGQVYFEVAHDRAKPFRVTVKGQTVEVLGTHFNINSYDDEAEIKTTLLEGSVKISFNEQSALLRPGEQAQIGVNKDKINIVHPDLDEVMAWKNGLFKFNNTDLQTTMRALTRWYDVEVVYNGSNKDYHFGGYIPRNSKLSEVLRILQLSGVKFSIDGKKLIVYQ